MKVQNKDDIDHKKRKILIGTVATTAAVGVVGAAVPFIGSWFPNARAKAAGAPVRVNVSKLEKGQQIVVEWRGQPVFVMRRTESQIADLTNIAKSVDDPDSLKSVQPQYTLNANRSIKAEILVVLGICTHLGCSPSFRPEIAPGDLGQDWLGGYFCPCHGSKYDFAGRVYKAQPAPLNLQVPPYRFESDEIIIIGEDTV